MPPRVAKFGRTCAKLRRRQAQACRWRAECGRTLASLSRFWSNLGMRQTSVRATRDFRPDLARIRDMGQPLAMSDFAGFRPTSWATLAKSRSNLGAFGRTRPDVGETRPGVSQVFAMPVEAGPDLANLLDRIRPANLPQPRLTLNRHTSGRTGSRFGRNRGPSQTKSTVTNCQAWSEFDKNTKV